MNRGYLLILLPLLLLQCKHPSPESATENVARQVKQVALPKITADQVMGRFDPETHPDFVEIESQYASRAGMWLHKQTYRSFKEMFAAAKKDGITLIIKSAARNFAHQKRIWEGKWDGHRLVEGGQNLAETTPPNKERALIILRYSSMPGSSRHHWGTDIDINAFENEYFESGQGLQEYEWLVAHAADYGFCQPYTAKDAERPDGYFEEKWHWSYLPVAQPLSEYVEKHFSNEMIDGFKGAETAVDIDIKNKYMLGINRACLHPKNPK